MVEFDNIVTAVYDSLPQEFFFVDVIRSVAALRREDLGGYVHWKLGDLAYAVMHELPHRLDNEYKEPGAPRFVKNKQHHY